MLFDVRPKVRREDFYDRDRELAAFMGAVRRGEPLIAVYGVRRVGKTSFVNVALNELNYPHALIDVREIYGIYRYITDHRLYMAIADYFTRRLGFLERMGFRLSEALAGVECLRVSSSGVEFIYRPGTRIELSRLLRKLDDYAGDHGIKFVLVFDEAQYLRYSSIGYNHLLAWAYDNLRNTTIVVTGSEVGVLRDFLSLDDPKSPLYGRYVREIKLERFAREQSIDFLMKGFSELGLSIPVKEIEEAVEKLDGNPGWLTMYGYYRGVVKRGHREALNQVFETGSRIVLSEIEKLIEPSRERYMAILEAIARGARTWKSIKTYVMYRTGPITDSRFTRLLKNLIRYCIVEEREGEYLITDPIILHAIERCLRRAR